jgi:HSP20 family protein
MLLARTRFPMSPLNELRREMDRLFDSFRGEYGGAWPSRQRVFPALNIWENAECLYAEAEVPGMKLDDLEILVVGNELTIKGRRQIEAGEKFAFHRQERRAGQFARVLTLPVEVNTEKVEATLKDGVLTIIMPKATAALARKITVKAG